MLYSFSDAKGSVPKSDLIAVGGVFFGTTASGGTDGFGTVFSITVDGQEHVLHNFTGLHGGGSDGRAPEGRLELLDRNFYGTTSNGGAHDLGTVFEIASDGKERVLYSFQGNDTGYYPYSGLTAVNGTFYGATLRGGSGDLGSIYEVKTNGSERIVHSFSSDGADGTYPRSELTVFKVFLYGTASSGGFNRDGTVFEVNPEGAFRGPHHFKGFLYTYSSGGTHCPQRQPLRYDQKRGPWPPTRCQWSRLRNNPVKPGRRSSKMTVYGSIAMRLGSSFPIGMDLTRLVVRES